MSRTVVIHQPDFLSYLGFFHRFLSADLWVVLDHVQFVTGTSKSWQNRDKIKTAQGERWITVPVQKAPHGTPINQILLASTDWRRDHLNLFKSHYGGAQFFNEVQPYLEALYGFQCLRLAEFNVKSSEILMDLFGINIPTVLASQLQPAGRSNQMLVDILKKVNADRYLSGLGAKAYFDPTPFAAAGIEVVWQNFTHPTYPQLHGDFLPYLSSIDLLFNCGAARSREIIRNC